MPAQSGRRSHRKQFDPRPRTLESQIRGGATTCQVQSKESGIQATLTWGFAQGDASSEMQGWGQSWPQSDPTTLERTGRVRTAGGWGGGGEELGRFWFSVCPRAWAEQGGEMEGDRRMWSCRDSLCVPADSCPAPAQGPRASSDASPPVAPPRICPSDPVRRPTGTHPRAVRNGWRLHPPGHKAAGGPGPAEPAWIAPPVHQHPKGTGHVDVPVNGFNPRPKAGAERFKTAKGDVATALPSASDHAAVPSTHRGT